MSNFHLFTSFLFIFHLSVFNSLAIFVSVFNLYTIYPQFCCLSSISSVLQLSCVTVLSMYYYPLANLYLSVIYHLPTSYTVTVFPLSITYPPANLCLSDIPLPHISSCCVYCPCSICVQLPFIYLPFVVKLNSSFPVSVISFHLSFVCLPSVFYPLVFLCRPSMHHFSFSSLSPVLKYQCVSQSFLWPIRQLSCAYVESLCHQSYIQLIYHLSARYSLSVFYISVIYPLTILYYYLISLNLIFF